MQGWKRARTLRLIVALFALSLTLSACETGDLLEFLNGDLTPPEAVPDPADEPPADDPADEPPADEPPADDPADQPVPDPAGDPVDEPATGDLSPIEQDIFDTLNATREDAGLDALALSADIAAGARDYSCTMAETGVFEHADLREAGVNGENIAAGQRSAAEVHEGWMNSPGHRENRMNARWTEYGVGVCEDDGGRLYYTERFR